MKNISDFLILDTETTGLDDNAEVVELSIIDNNSNIVFNKLIKPINPIPLEAQRIHGITNEMVADELPLSSYIDEIEDKLSGKPLIIYNAPYDIRLINQSMSLAGKPIDIEFVPSEILCLMRHYASIRKTPNPKYGGEYRWHSLTNACEYEGIEVTNAHRALGDCMMTLALLQKIIERY